MNVLKDWVLPIISAVFTLFIAPLLYEYFVTIRPEITQMKVDINTIIENQKTIESVYTKVDKDGKPCKIGVGMDKTGATVYVYTHKDLGLKNNDIIYISNPFSPFKQSIWCTVCLLEPTAKDIEGIADMYLSREALKVLGKNEAGVFNMSYKTKKEDMQSEMMEQTD